MKLTSITALMLMLAAAPASAQSAGSVSADIEIKPPVTRLPADLKCRLGLINPRGCVPPQAQPSTRPTHRRTAAAPVRSARR